MQMIEISSGPTKKGILSNDKLGKLYCTSFLIINAFQLYILQEVEQ